MAGQRSYHLTLAPIVLAAAFMTGGGAVADDAKVTGFKGEMLMWIEDAQDKLSQLAEAIPEDKYSWKPAEGVRTVADVFMHVSAANYGVPSFIGVSAPKGFDFGTYEKSLTKKSDIMKSLKDSFAHMESALKGMSDEEMNQPAEFFGMKTTKRGAFLLLLSHAHEHLGQQIAYARSIHVTPPWSGPPPAAETKPAKK